MTQFTVAMRRWGPVPVVMLAILAAMAVLAAPSADARAKKTRHALPTVEKAHRAAGEPIMAIVSLKSQRVTFYDADGWITRAPVSTGTKGRETPAGIFAVVEKDKNHHSSMYGNAWMPNMQRITWNGIAMHGGPLPGFAASHGCIRMPYPFAEQMFDKTRIGMRVIVAPGDAAPVAFSHPALFVPDAKAIAAAPARAKTLAAEAAEAATAASKAEKAARAASHAAASLDRQVRRLERLKPGAEARLASADERLAAADKARAQAEAAKQMAAVEVVELATQLGTAKAGTRLARRLGWAKTRAEGRLAVADRQLAAADKAKGWAEELRQKEAAKVAELMAQLDTAMSDPKSQLAAATKAVADEAEARKTATAKAATEAKLATEPVSVYISRATQKLYVRRNTHKPWPDGGEVFASTIEVPVTIRDPDRPIGTHIFTAMAGDKAGLRWTAVTIEGADDASDALDRITIPQDVLDRIAPTAVPRSSIVVSDEPLSKETNYRTEFVAVLSDYPQGGFITRRVTSGSSVRKRATTVRPTVERKSRTSRWRGWLQRRTR